MASSKFVRLNDFCLIEYIEGNLSSTPINQNFYTVSNTQTKTIQVFNTITDSAYTNNNEEFTSLYYNNNTFYKYDRDTIPSIFSYAPSVLTRSSLISDSIIYDTVKFHFKSGFNFGAFTGGLTLQAKARMNNGLYNILASVLVDATTAYDLISLNPEPLNLSTTRYDKYIQVNFPSLKYLNNNYYATPDASKSTTMGYRLSNGVGFINNGNIYFSVDECLTSSPIVNGDVIYELSSSGTHKECSITATSIYDNLGVVVTQSSAGDFIEFYMSYDSGFVADFIGQLMAQNPSASYTIIHQLTIYEQLGTGSFVQTDTVTMYQTSKFDSYCKFVPVLEYADRAVSFSIDYVATLYNENDGSQIVKQGSYTSTDVKMYGKKRQVLFDSSTVSVNKIYNKIVRAKEDNLDLYADSQFVDDRAKRDSGTITYQDVIVNQPYYIDMNNISVCDVNLISKEIDVTKNLIFKQGDLRLFVKPFDNVYKVKVYERRDGYLGYKQLSSVDTYKLVFVDGVNKMSISNEQDNVLGNMSAGELAFKLLETDAMKVMGFKSRGFSITCNNTEMYKGEWLLNSETALYNSHIKAIKEEQQTDVQMQNAIKDLQEASASSGDVIGSNVYVAGYVPQASNNSEKSASKMIDPKS